MSCVHVHLTEVKNSGERVNGLEGFGRGLRDYVEDLSDHVLSTHLRLLRVHMS